MDYKTISDKQARRILDKYWTGESSLVEEAALKVYFNSTNIPEDLISLRPMFLHFKNQQQIKIDDIELPLNHPIPSFSNNWRNWGMSMAASVILVIASVSTLHYFSTESNTNTVRKEINTIATLNTEQKKAFEETKAALLLVSSKLNHGKVQAEKGLRYIQK